MPTRLAKVARTVNGMVMTTWPMTSRVNGSNSWIADAKPRIEKPTTTVGTNFGDRNSVSTEVAAAATRAARAR